MKRLLLPVLIAALPVSVSADVEVYGRAHLALEQLDNGASYSELNMASRASRLGVRANRALDGNLTVLMQIEQGVNYDEGEAFTANRNTFVGLRGEFGMVRVGHFDTPFKGARGPANIFGDQLGDIRNVTRVGNGRFDERTSNTLHYRSPRLGDLHFDVAYSVNQGSTAGDGEDDDAVSLAATYAAGPLTLSAAFETWGSDTSAGERDGLRLAGAYALDQQLTLVGFFQTLDHDVDDAYTSDVVGAGVSYQLTDRTGLRGHYLHRLGELDDSDSGMFAIGVDHRLADGLRVYANLALMSNDDAVALTPWSATSTAPAPGAPGETSTGLGAGLIYDF